MDMRMLKLCSGCISRTFLNYCDSILRELFLCSGSILRGAGALPRGFRFGRNYARTEYIVSRLWPPCHVGVTSYLLLLSRLYLPVFATSFLSLLCFHVDNCLLGFPVFFFLHCLRNLCLTTYGRQLQPSFPFFCIPNATPPPPVQAPHAEQGNVLEKLTGSIHSSRSLHATVYCAVLKWIASTNLCTNVACRIQCLCRTGAREEKDGSFPPGGGGSGHLDLGIDGGWRAIRFLQG